jgi:hypothetical protein
MHQIEATYTQHDGCSPNVPEKEKLCQMEVLSGIVEVLPDPPCWQAIKV